MSAIYLLLFITGILGDKPDICCDYGYQTAGTSLLENVSCNPDNTVLSKFKEPMMKIMCKSFYQSCCQDSAKIQYCIKGKKMAIANQVCMGSRNLGGDKQFLCCECCKKGRKMAETGGVCEKNVKADDLCQHAFLTCCKDTQAAIPTKEPNSRKTCQDLRCDPATTRICINGDDGPQCLCKDGFVAQNDGITCVDINECTSDENDCPESCVNVPGSYTCPCPIGMTTKDGKCIESKECERGYILHDGKCLDIDECQNKQHRCPNGSYCLNTPGSYRCTSHCNFPNYKVIGPGLCADVDECKEGNHQCNEYFKCINKIGSYICQRVKCFTGYRLVDQYCEDIDECAEDPDICGKHGKCRNRNGNHYCDCQQGFKINHLTGKCEDEDECRLKIDKQCSHECINTLGSYRCSCPDGYETRGKYCYDIDECARHNQCQTGEFCFNTFGSYQCINDSCPVYYRSIFTHRSSPAGCTKECNGDLNCEKLPLQSMKRVAYQFWKDVNPRDFTFTYTTGFSSQYYNVSFRLKGNEERIFRINYLSNSKIEILNQYQITGPKEYHIILQTDVTLLSTGVLTWQYEYHFFIFVAEHKFA